MKILQASLLIMLLAAAAPAMAQTATAPGANNTTATAPGGDTSRGTQKVDKNDRDFDMGWLGLIGLGGLAGLMGRNRRTHTADVTRPGTTTNVR